MLMSPKVTWTHVRHAMCHLDPFFLQNLYANCNVTCIAHLWSFVSYLPLAMYQPHVHFSLGAITGRIPWRTRSLRLRETWDVERLGLID